MPPNLTDPVDDPRSDEQLVDAANQLDSAAFEILYYRYRDWILQAAFRITSDRELALDVMQESFAYFARKFPGFRLSAKLKTFFYHPHRDRWTRRRYQTTVPE